MPSLQASNPKLKTLLSLSLLKQNATRHEERHNLSLSLFSAQGESLLLFLSHHKEGYWTRRRRQALSFQCARRVAPACSNCTKKECYWTRRGANSLSLSLSFQCARRAPLLFENASTRNSTGHDEEDLESRAVGSTVWLHVGSLRLHGAVVSSDKTKGCLPGKRQTLS